MPQSASPMLQTATTFEGMRAEFVRSGTVAEIIRATRKTIRESRDLLAWTDELIGKVSLAADSGALDYTALAHRYSDWARDQIAWAEMATNQKDKREHVALAERYLQLAAEELLAATRAKQQS